MKIAVIGSTGFVGSNIINELVNRNFEVLGISNSSTESSSVTNLTYLNIDVNNINELAEKIKGYDVLISAFSAGWSNPNYHEDYMNS